MQRLKASESIPVRCDPLRIECGVPTFDCKDAQMVDARFMDEVIRVHKLVREGDLTEIEGGGGLSTSLSGLHRCAPL